jgi:hypothetical protein
MNAEQRLAYLLESVFVPTNALVTIGMIRNALPTETYGLVLATFAGAKIPASNSFADIAKAAEMESSFIAMSGSGLGLSTPDRQAVIDQLAAAGEWPNAVRDAVKVLGGVSRPRWQIEGYQSAPTLESVQKQMLIDATRTAVNSRTTAINGWLDAIDMSQSLAEIEAYIADLLSSVDGNPPRGGD